MSRSLLLVSAFALILGSVACASPPTDDEVRGELRRAAESVFGARYKPRLVVLNAQSKMEAWSHMAESAADGPSRRARAVGRDFKKARRRRVGIVIGGPQSDLVDRFVRDAFEAAGTDKLPGLAVVVVSAEPPSDFLERAARERGAKLVHRSYARR